MRRRKRVWKFGAAGSRLGENGAAEALARLGFVRRLYRGRSLGSFRSFRRRRGLGALITGEWADDGAEVAVTKGFWRGIRVTISSGTFNEFVHHLIAELLMGALAALKTEFDPDFHILVQKANNLIKLYTQIVRVDGSGNLDLFHFAGGTAAGVFGPLDFVIEEFAVFSNETHGWRGAGGNLDQIQVLRSSKAQSVMEAHDTKLLFDFVDHLEDANFASANLSVAAMEWFPGKAA